MWRPFWRNLLRRPPSRRRKLTIGFVEIEGDARYEPIRAYERIILEDPRASVRRREVGIDEAAALSRVLKMDFALDRIAVKSPEEVAPAVLKALDTRHPFLPDRRAGGGLQTRSPRR